VVVAGAAILSSLMIMVSEMNLLDPEITPLVPVLKSYWLMIHVAIITASYAFLGLGCIFGLLNLTLYIFRNKKNGEVVTLNISELTYISEMSITIGLFMLTIGTFLGGVWANESWGRYWGWDPKETWALVSVLVYAVILHLRLIPGLKGKFLFNVVSFWGYSAILFTFFGVNFMLVGLHSYAQGDGIGKFPGWLTILIIVMVIYTVIAGIRNKQYNKAIK
jgi:cytochrome c-type biogenesis protein CcsB